MKELKDMSYDELSQLITDARLEQAKKYDAYKEENERKYKEGVEKRRKARNKAIREDLPKIIAFARQWIKPGDIVKFLGTNGSNLREVIELRDEGILGMVGYRDRKTHKFVRESYSSENQYLKLNGWQGKGMTKMMSREEIINYKA